MSQPGDFEVTRGKTDRPGTSREFTGAAYAIISTCWSEVFSLCSPPGPEEDFFESGGSSLTAILLAARLDHAGLPLSVHDIFDHPSVSALAQIVVSRQS